MWHDGCNYTYSGDHFTLYRNIESLCCTPETNTLYVNYTSIKIKISEAEGHLDLL